MPPELFRRRKRTRQGVIRTNAFFHYSRPGQIKLSLVTAYLVTGFAEILTIYNFVTEIILIANCGTNNQFFFRYFNKI